MRNGRNLIFDADIFEALGLRIMVVSNRELDLEIACAAVGFRNLLSFCSCAVTEVPLITRDVTVRIARSGGIEPHLLIAIGIQSACREGSDRSEIFTHR